MGGDWHGRHINWRQQRSPAVYLIMEVVVTHALQQLHLGPCLKGHKMLPSIRSPAQMMAKSD